MDGATIWTGLIPRSNRTCWCIALLGTCLIAILVLLYASWIQWELFARFGFQPSDGRIAVLDLDGEGSLAVWYSSTLLFLSGQLAFLIGHLKHQGLSEKHSSSRIWFVSAICWLTLSLDETASIHEAFKELASIVSGTRIYGDGSLWWAIPYFCVLSFVGLKIFDQMRFHPIEKTLFLSTGGCWALAVITQLELLLPASGARGVILEEASEMMGNLLLFPKHVIVCSRARTRTGYNDRRCRYRNRSKGIVSAPQKPCKSQYPKSLISSRSIPIQSTINP